MSARAISGDTIAATPHRTANTKRPTVPLMRTLAFRSFSIPPLWAEIL
jgi:hypothetical protein